MSLPNIWHVPAVSTSYLGVIDSNHIDMVNIHIKRIYTLLIFGLGFNSDAYIGFVPTLETIKSLSQPILLDLYFPKHVLDNYDCYILY